MPEFMSSRFN
jgi:hypothetical protein